MSKPSAYVYDLDGTLISLAVDWDAVRTAVAEVYQAAGIRAAEANLWDLLDRARAHGLAEAVEETIADYERKGAEHAKRLPVASEIPNRTEPVGVCSLNCESACRIALARHGLLSHVDALVGRDSVRAVKPDPVPLLAVIQQLGVEPEDTLFIGDSRRDAITAERAGTRFAYVSERPRSH